MDKLLGSASAGTATFWRAIWSPFDAAYVWHRAWPFLLRTAAHTLIVVIELLWFRDLIDVRMIYHLWSAQLVCTVIAAAWHTGIEPLREHVREHGRHLQALSLWKQTLRTATLAAGVLAGGLVLWLVLDFHQRGVLAVYKWAVAAIVLGLAIEIITATLYAPLQSTRRLRRRTATALISQALPAVVLLVSYRHIHTWALVLAPLTTAAISVLRCAYWLRSTGSWLHLRRTQAARHTSSSTFFSLPLAASGAIVAAETAVTYVACTLAVRAQRPDIFALAFVLQPVPAFVRGVAESLKLDLWRMHRTRAACIAARTRRYVMYAAPLVVTLALMQGLGAHVALRVAANQSHLQFVAAVPAQVGALVAVLCVLFFLHASWQLALVRLDLRGAAALCISSVVATIAYLAVLGQATTVALSGGVLALTVPVLYWHRLIAAGATRPMPTRGRAFTLTSSSVTARVLKLWWQSSAFGASHKHATHDIVLHQLSRRVFALVPAPSTPATEFEAAVGSLLATGLVVPSAMPVRSASSHDATAASENARVITAWNSGVRLSAPDAAELTSAVERWTRGERARVGRFRIDESPRPSNGTVALTVSIARTPS